MCTMKAQHGLRKQRPGYYQFKPEKSNENIPHSPGVQNPKEQMKTPKIHLVFLLSQFLSPCKAAAKGLLAGLNKKSRAKAKAKGAAKPGAKAAD